MVPYRLDGCFCTDFDVRIKRKDVRVKVKNLWLFELVVHVRVNQIVSYFHQVVVKVDMTVYQGAQAGLKAAYEVLICKLYFEKGLEIIKVE